MHAKGLEKNLKKSKQYKESTFISIIRWKFKQDLDCILTYGYKTFVNRCEIGLEKSHVNDAFIIANGNNQLRTKPYEVQQVKRNNRCLQINRRGFKPFIRRQKYQYQPKDLIKVNNQICEVKGVFNYGDWIRYLDKFGKTKNILIKKVELLKYQKGLAYGS